MFLVKVLERKGVIRFFGFLLLLSPFFNTFAKMSLLTELSNRWSFKVFWQILMMGSLFNQILYVATLIIGILMLRGSVKAWNFALVLLAGYIALQVSDFGHVRASKVTWLFFITNIFVFLFIADQLVWKVKATKPAPTKEKVPAPLIHKKIIIHFAGMGPWAQVLSISNKGIHVRSLKAPPLDITSRELEISLKNGLTLRTRFASNSNQDYFFNYISLSPEEINSLNQWILSIS
ncbi:MAG TPA: hypothetical protein VIG33_13965 [Pseudobdellovibrionaceae bacterium]|jgi:hypothetical protein